MKKEFLTQEQFHKLLKQLKISYSIVDDIEVEPYSYSRSRYVSLNIQPKEFSFYCHCKNGAGDVYTHELCPHCGNGIYREPLRLYKEDLEKKFNEKKAEISSTTGMSVYSYERFPNSANILNNAYFVAEHPDDENGIRIYRLSVVVSYKKSKLVVDYKVQFIIDIIPGKEIKAYKVVRDSLQDVDFFTAFNLSSHTKRYEVNIIWDGYKNGIDFMLNHKSFAKQTAYMEIFNNLELSLPRNSLFMIYMYLYSQYPVIELLAKMGYTHLLNNVIANVANSPNRDIMKKQADELTKVFNPHSTKGSLSLNIPKYIGDYLNACGANYEEYRDWVDLCELTSISKENFNKLISSEEYSIVRRHYSYSLRQIINLLKYDYKLEKLLKYVVKQKELIGEYVGSVIGYMNDYRNMLEIMDIEADEYPKNIKTAHDNLVVAFKAKKSEHDNIKMKQVADNAKKHIPENDDYIIVMPESVQALVEEGQQQHNCVASYANRVVGGACVIFFIRNKETPDASYVTAEYRDGRLVQIKEKNNYSVSNKLVLDFAHQFCNNLSKDKNFI